MKYVFIMIAILPIIALGLFSHVSVVKTQSEILIYKLYVECTQEQQKEQCSYLLKHQRTGDNNGIYGH